MLDPASDYYEHAGTYWGWRFAPTAIWLSIVVGEVKGLLSLKTLLLQTGARYVGWDCRKNSPAYAWGRYWQAYVQENGTYPDGAPTWRFTLDLTQSRRLQKNMASVAIVAIEPVKG